MDVTVSGDCSIVVSRHRKRWARIPNADEHHRLIHCAYFRPNELVLGVHQGHEDYGMVPLVVVVQRAPTRRTLYSDVLPVQGTHTVVQLPSVAELVGDVFPLLWRLRTGNYFLSKLCNYRIADLTDNHRDGVVCDPEAIH